MLMDAVKISRATVFGRVNKCLLGDESAPPRHLSISRTPTTKHTQDGADCMLQPGRVSGTRDLVDPKVWRMCQARDYFRVRQRRSRSARGCRTIVGTPSRGCASQAPGEHGKRVSQSQCGKGRVQVLFPERSLHKEKSFSTSRTILRQGENIEKEKTNFYRRRV